MGPCWQASRPAHFAALSLLRESPWPGIADEPGHSPRWPNELDDCLILPA
jgi:hypothetical protein